MTMKSCIELAKQKEASMVSFIINTFIKKKSVLWLILIKNIT